MDIQSTGFELSGKPPGCRPPQIKAAKCIAHSHAAVKLRFLSKTSHIPWRTIFWYDKKCFMLSYKETGSSSIPNRWLPSTQWPSGKSPHHPRTIRTAHAAMRFASKEPHVFTIILRKCPPAATAWMRCNMRAIPVPRSSSVTSPLRCSLPNDPGAKCAAYPNG